MFEYQLMPALVGLLNRSSAGKGKGSEGGGQGQGLGLMQEDGLDFASVWVFACVGECCDPDPGAEGEGAGEGGGGVGWREERVLVEWEDE